MDIFYLGHSSFRIKGKTATLEVNNGQINFLSDTPFVIKGPGEYEVKGVSIIGIGDESNTIYVIEMDGMRVCHLGDLGHKLSEAQLEEISSVDIAMVPVAVTEAVKQVDPWIIIPYYDKQPELDAFLKEMGKTVEPQTKLVISRDKLPEETQVVWLK